MRTAFIIQSPDRSKVWTDAMTWADFAHGMPLWGICSFQFRPFAVQSAEMIADTQELDHPLSVAEVRITDDGTIQSKPSTWEAK